MGERDVGNWNGKKGMCVGGFYSFLNILTVG